MDILQKIQYEWKNWTKQVCIIVDHGFIEILLIENNYAHENGNYISIAMIPYDNDDKITDTINLISSRYKLFIHIQQNISEWKKINITPNVYHICNLQFITGTIFLKYSHKIINLFFTHIPLLTSNDIDSMINHFEMGKANRWCFSYKHEHVMIDKTINIIMNYITNRDIPLSKQNIIDLIKLKIEIPYIHKYGYNMNDPEFLYAYIKSDFYPQSYNIDMDLVNEYK